MNLTKTLRRGLTIATLMVAFLFLAAACGGESTPTATPPTAIPTPTLSDVLTNAGENMAAMSSAKFDMVDEKESGAKFFDTTFKSLEAEVKAPDSFRMLVDVVSPAFGFIEIEMMAVGEQAFIKFSKDAPWAPLPLDGVPFNFSGLGMTFSPNPPKDTDGRREDRGRGDEGAIGGWPGLHWGRWEVIGRSSAAAQGPYGRLRELGCAGWRENTQQGTLADRDDASLRGRWVNCRLAVRLRVEWLAAGPRRD